MAPSAYTPFMSKVGGDAADDGLRLMTQELAVDGLRYILHTLTSPFARFSDMVRFMLWQTLGLDGHGMHTHTQCFEHRSCLRARPAHRVCVVAQLVLMTIDMWKIAEHANPNGTAILPSHWCAALQPVIIFFGSIPRFYLNECRFQRGLEGMPQRVAPWAWIIGALSFLIATTLFSVCAASLVEFIWDDGTPSDVNMRLSDAYVMTILMLLQIGYPLVFLFSTVYMHLCSGDWRSRGGDYPAWLSFCAHLKTQTLALATPLPPPLASTKTINLFRRQGHGLRLPRHPLQGRPGAVRGHARHVRGVKIHTV